MKIEAISTWMILIKAIHEQNHIEKNAMREVYRTHNANRINELYEQKLKTKIDSK